jgi:hypothetical protein
LAIAIIFTPLSPFSVCLSLASKFRLFIPNFAFQTSSNLFANQSGFFNLSIFTAFAPAQPPIGFS